MGTSAILARSFPLKRPLSHRKVVLAGTKLYWKGMKHSSSVHFSRFLFQFQFILLATNMPVPFDLRRKKENLSTSALIRACFFPMGNCFSPKLHPGASASPGAAWFVERKWYLSAR